jgi:membrane-bound metal-dependent hydrolase YbcI (DUF457 family)
MFAIGHFALGYLTGKGSSKLLKTQLNLPLLLAVSVIPDIDLILQTLNDNLFMHRGPTHSIVTFTLLMIPFFIIYRKKAVPYYVTLLSHSLLGDYFTGGVELFWPLSNKWFVLADIDLRSLPSVTTEIVLFAIALAIMLKSKDLQSILKPSKYNLALIIGFGAALGPMLPSQSGGGLETGSLPLLLWIPSVFCLVLFGYSILIGLRKVVSHKAQNAAPNTAPEKARVISLMQEKKTEGTKHAEVRLPNISRRISRSSRGIQQPNRENRETLRS